MYHRLGSGALPGREEGEDVYAVPPQTFEEHMRLLASSGCHVAPLEALAGGGERRRSVVLTFDDGNATDWSEALPALERHGHKAAFFISPALVGTHSYMDWAQVRELAKAGMTVGAHGFDHARLSTLSENQVRWQLREARRAMESQLGRAPETLSLPGGAGSALVLAVAREEGFGCVLGSVPRRCLSSEGLLPRFALRRGDSLGEFRSLVEQRPLAILKHSVRYRLLSGLRGAIGGRFYAHVRRVWAKDGGRA
jgi:peptidoglycan/xylan/chitin deacetylase (PgdA/CDA1 family)